MTMNFHFWGRIGRNASACSGRAQPAPLWQQQIDDFGISVTGKFASSAAAWQSLTDRPSRPAVFVAGSLYLGDDTQYGERTVVKPLAMGSAPETIARLFERHGTNAFGLLDGDFTVVIFNPRFKTVYLVVDKLGCCDLYLRKDNDSVLFSSEPMDLFQKDEAFDRTAISFLLAHEGYVPAPFTISPKVEAIGRAKFAEISLDGDKVRCNVQRYWLPLGEWDLRSPAESRDKLFTALKDAVSVRLGDRPSVLVSGGIDSSLLLGLAASQVTNLVALTGSVKNWDQGEEEIANSRSLASAYGVPHEVVVLDPHDEHLPEESIECSTSWLNGIRLTLPLWRRFAIRLRDRLGTGYNVLAGQTADTLADNNYTLPSTGYTVRRMLFSSWFLRMMPVISAITPRNDTAAGKVVVACANSLAGPRVASMVQCVLEGLVARDLFYAGRIFGYGEMPGVAKDRFPMLTRNGFQHVLEWYCSNFVRPVTEDVDPSNFYRQMIQMSMDMNMLHLDSRLLFHTYRQEGGRAQLPFMDARIVTFFGSVPYSARALYREPKYLIRSQLKRPGMRYPPKTASPGTGRFAKCQDQLLLEGTLGVCYRELLRQPTLPERTPGLFDLVEESYYDQQIRAFRREEQGVDYRFIAKIGTLEVWNRARLSQDNNQDNNEDKSLVAMNRA